MDNFTFTRRVMIVTARLGQMKNAHSILVEKPEGN